MSWSAIALADVGNAPCESGKRLDSVVWVDRPLVAVSVGAAAPTPNVVSS
jgi:hypothetical protein